MTWEAVDRLENGDLDAAFIYGKPTLEKLFSVEVQKLKMIVAGPLKWKKEIVHADLKKLENFPWIVTPDNCPFQRITSELFKKYGISPQEVASVDQESVIKTMVRAGVGLSVLLERDVVEDSCQENFAIWDNEDLTLSLSVICLKRRKDELLLKTLMSVLSRVWEQILPIESD